MEDETPALERAGAGGGVALVVEVDVIVPIHNASRTLRDALHSAFHQRVVRLRPPSSASIDDHSPSSIDDDDKNNNNNEQEEGGSKKSRDTGVPLVLEVVVHVCCYDDGSTDDSWEILLQIAKEYTQKKRGEHAACSKIASGRTAEEDGQGRCRDQTGQCLCETKEEAPAAAISSSTLPHAPGTMLVRSCAVRGKRNGKSNNHVGCTYYAETHLHIAQSPDGVSRGAGYARNRAVEMRPAMGSLGNHKEQDRPKHNDCGNACDDKDEPNATYPPHHQFLCLLDSDDIMSENRVLVQVHYLLSLSSAERNRCLLGCNFSRDPPDSTARYTQWANSLSDDRLGLERYREVTVLQPTWMMCRSWFDSLGGYLEAPHPSRIDSDPSCDSVQAYVLSLVSMSARGSTNAVGAASAKAPLVHPSETFHTLRLAEDLRFFHAHLALGGIIRKCAGEKEEQPLVVYRHVGPSSQSHATSRKLLLQLRTLAFERHVLDRDPRWAGRKFAVWGAGRDGKDFCKALRPDTRERIRCLADVDNAKILGNGGHYVNSELGLRIPIVHFSYLARDPEQRERLTRLWMDGLNDANHGRVDKRRAGITPPSATDPVSSPQAPTRKRKLACDRELDLSLLSELPVVVCVVMNRTNGALERNVKLIGRTEGVDLWHFS